MCLAAAVLCTVLCFWNVFRSGAAPFSRQPEGYYPLLAAGFHAGHLFVPLEPAPALLALPNPYDPVANAAFRVHDMSLFRGKFYLYYGVTPVVVFFWPMVAATGLYPSEPFAVGIFCLVGVAAGLALLCALRRRHFPEAPLWSLALAAACLAFGTPVLVLAARSGFYQVPIACAYGLTLLMWGAIYCAIHSSRRGVAWLAAASLLYGLAVGARPNLLPLSIALVIVGACLSRRAGREAPQGPGRGVRWRAALAVVGPAAACGGGLALYNWLRFGSIFEFGLRYQLAGIDQLTVPLFGLRNLLPHARDYLFGAGSWQRYFPFFSPFPGSPYGLLRYAPWHWLLLFACWPAAAGGAGDRRGAAVMAGALVSALAASFLLLLFFVGANDRYVSDYLPALQLLAGMGAFALGSRLPGRPPARVLAGLALCAAAACSILTGLGSFASALPDEAIPLALARSANAPAAWYERLTGAKLGAIRIELVLPAGKAGLTEPLLETGARPDRRDWVEILYLTAGTARINLFHAGVGRLRGNDFPIPPDRRIRLEASLGSLLPPFAHPAFARWTREQYEARRRDDRLIVNGREVLRLELDCYPSPPQDVRLRDLEFGHDGLNESFSGRLLSWQRLPLDPPQSAPSVAWARTPIELQVLFPIFLHPATEPLVVTGGWRQSDLLGCRYDGPGRLHFIVDHFGYPTLAGPPVQYDPLRPHQLAIWLGSLASAGQPGDGRGSIPWSRRVVVMFDGTPALDEVWLFYPADPASLEIGENPHGASTALPRFTGRVLTAHPAGDFGSLPERRPVGQAGPVRMRVAFPGNVPGTAEPLVVTGRVEAGDLLYVRYVDGTHVAFGFDHWGVGGLSGPVTRVDFGKPHLIELTMDSLYPPDWRRRPPPGLVRVVLDGLTVLEGNSPCYPSSVDEISVGRNPLGGSTAGPAFTGRVLTVERGSP